MSKAFLLAPVFLLATLVAFSQKFNERFKELSAANDTTAQAALLKDWEKAAPKDPELFIAYFNFYVAKSRKEIVSLGPEKKEGSFELSDTTGKAAGYLSSSLKYDAATLQKGFNYIDRGIALHPTRLDMRFGKIFMLGEAENFPAFTKAIIEAVEHGNKIRHAWLWKEGEVVKDGKDFFLGSMQEYVATIYNMEDEELLPYMRQISEAVLKYFPAHVESLANVALTYLIVGDNDKALPYLLKAEKADPKDIIVLNNIAEAYKRKNDKVNAKIYYEKIIKYGNEEEVLDAKERLKEL